MKEIRKSGNKEFFLTLFWALVILSAGSSVMESMPSFKMIGAIVTIVLFFVLGFFTLTRYSAKFTYEITSDTLKVTRNIGKKVKEIEFNLSEIISMTSYRPKDMPKPVYNMRVCVVSDKKSQFIIYGYNGSRKTLIFEPSDKFMAELKNAVKESKKKGVK